MKKRCHVIYSGRVQGVGFRYTARALADKYHLSGWVMNLSDGGVALEVEGKTKDLDNLLCDLQDEFKDYIKGIDLNELPYSGEYNDFRIRFY